MMLLRNSYGTISKSEEKKTIDVALRSEKKKSQEGKGELSLSQSDQCMGPLNKKGRAAIREKGSRYE